jgi:hypothetical protein
VAQSVADKYSLDNNFCDDKITLLVKESGILLPQKLLSQLFFSVTFLCLTVDQYFHLKKYYILTIKYCIADGTCNIFCNIPLLLSGILKLQ